MSGGFIPTNRRDIELHGYVHLADWYPTLSILAGASPHDVPSKLGNITLPGVDGYNLWPSLPSNLFHCHHCSFRFSIPPFH